MNNEQMTLAEMAEISEAIYNEDVLSEDILSSLKEFLVNYKSMKDILEELQLFLKDKAMNRKSNFMGDGTFLKAYNASKKVDAEMHRMNKEAKNFIILMKDALNKLEQ